MTPTGRPQLSAARGEEGGETNFKGERAEGKRPAREEGGKEDGLGQRREREREQLWAERGSN